MSNLTSIIVGLSMLPLAGAGVLGIVNMPKPLPQFETITPVYEEYKPLDLQDPAITQVDDVVIVVPSPKAKQTKWQCGNWGKTRILNGQVRRCEYK